MPFVDRDDGVRIFWEESGEGPALVVIHSYIQHPKVMEGLMAELGEGHRVIRFDPRGAGESTRGCPYGMDMDIDDLIAVVEAVAPIAAVVANGDATNRAVRAAAKRPDLIPCVISMETVPLLPGQAEGTEALVASGGVLEALVGMMRNDYRTGLTAGDRRINEPKAARLTAELVLDNRGGCDLPERFKCLLHIRFGGLMRQVADVEIHRDLPCCVSLPWTFLRTGASFTP